MCSGKERGNKLGFISDDKKAQSNCKILTKLPLGVFNDGFNTFFWR